MCCFQSPNELPATTFQILLKNPKKTIIQLIRNWKQINIYFWSPFGLNMLANSVLITIISFILTPLTIIYFFLKLKTELSFKITALTLSSYLVMLLYFSIALIESNWVFVCVPFFLLWIYKCFHCKKYYSLAFTYLILINTVSCSITINHIYSTL